MKALITVPQFIVSLIVLATLFKEMIVFIVSNVWIFWLLHIERKTNLPLE